MRKRILKSTTLKTANHIALFRIEFRSHCTIFSVEFLPCDWLDLIYLGDIKDLNTFVNSITLLNIQLLWFQVGQGLKKGDFSAFLKGR